MLKIGEKEKWKIKGTNKSSILILVYMTHLPTFYVCTKFQFSRPHSSWEKSDETFQCWKLERKKNEEIKGRIRSSSLILVYMIHLPTVQTCTNIQPSGPHSSWEKCDKNILMFENWRKRKMKNKGTNMQQQLPDSSIHHTSTRCPRVYQVSTF